MRMRVCVFAENNFEINIFDLGIWPTSARILRQNPWAIVRHCFRDPAFRCFGRTL